MALQPRRAGFIPVPVLNAGAGFAAAGYDLAGQYAAGAYEGIQGALRRNGRRRTRAMFEGDEPTFVPDSDDDDPGRVDRSAQTEPLANAPTVNSSRGKVFNYFNVLKQKAVASEVIERAKSVKSQWGNWNRDEGVIVNPQRIIVSDLKVYTAWQSAPVLKDLGTSPFGLLLQYPLANISQGTAANERIGNKIRVYGFALNFLVYWTANACTGDVLVRVVICFNKAFDGADVHFWDVYHDSGNYQSYLLAHPNVEETHRINILKEEMFTVSRTATMNSLSDTVYSYNSPGASRQWKVNFDPPLEIDYGSPYGSSYPVQPLNVVGGCMPVSFPWADLGTSDVMWVGKYEIYYTG